MVMIRGGEGGGITSQVGTGRRSKKLARGKEPRAPQALRLWWG